MSGSHIPLQNSLVDLHTRNLDTHDPKMYNDHEQNSLNKLRKPLDTSIAYNNK